MSSLECNESGEIPYASDLVSVVIPCYGAQPTYVQFLDDAIASVISQTYRHFEVIVVSDGSPEVQKTVARYPNVRYVSKKTRNLGAARNVGLRESKGSYVAFLDVDDRLLPRALEIGVKMLRAHPKCAFVYGHVTFIASDGSPLPTEEQFCVDNDYYFVMLHYSYIWTTAVVMYRRDILESIGGYRLSPAGTEDWELNLRITRVSPIFCHGKVVAEYRRHGQNITRDNGLMLKSSLSTLRTQLQHIRGNKRLEQAYRTGRRVVQEYYGIPLSDAIRSHLGAGETREATRDAFILALYYPQGFVKCFFPKLSRIVLAIGNALSDINVKATFLAFLRMSEPSPPVYEGSHEWTDCQSISGWAWDVNQPNRAIKVDICADDFVLTTARANEFRLDLAIAGKGNGCHVFRCPIPTSLKDGRLHSIRVKFHGTNVDLSLTPKVISC